MSYVHYGKRANTHWNHPFMNHSSLGRIYLIVISFYFVPVLLPFAHIKST